MTVKIMTTYEKIISKKEKLAVVGLGYVGMPIAVEFAKTIDVIGFDINKAKIEAYKKGTDPTSEVGDDTIKASKVEWTSDERKLSEASFILSAPIHPYRLKQSCPAWWTRTAPSLCPAV